MSSGFVRQDLPVSRFDRGQAKLTRGQEILLVNTRQDANLYKANECSKPDSSSMDGGCCKSSSTCHDLESRPAPSLEEYDLNDWIGQSIKSFVMLVNILTSTFAVASFQIYAVKG